MSIKRYWMDDQNDADFPYECTDGDWVKYEDYARLETNYAAATQWRPIETAPKDGIDVLCISGEYMFVAWIDSRGYWNSGDDSHFIPDYWMPLPKPPAAKEGKQP